MSDTVVVMNQGVIQQIGTPEDIYNEPKNSLWLISLAKATLFQPFIKVIKWWNLWMLSLTVSMKTS